MAFDIFNALTPSSPGASKSEPLAIESIQF